MLFKKGVLPVPKDVVAETYKSAFEEHHSKIKARTEEIRKLLKEKLNKSIDTANIVEKNDQNSTTDTSL